MSAVDQYQTVFNQTLDVANAAYKANDWDQAVERYKSVGAVGAQQLGPAIDSQTSGASSDLTQEAWTLNSKLAEINSGAYNGTAATQADADEASTFVSQMWQAYQQALAGVTTAPAVASSVAAAKTASRPGVGSPVAPVASTGSSTSSATSMIGGALIGAAVVGVVIGTLPAAIGGAIAGTLLGMLLGKKGA